MLKNKNILFACTQNVVRSMIAEHVFYMHYSKELFQVYSCGVRKGISDGFAYSVMKEIGINVENHKIKTFEEYEPENFDIVFSFSNLASKGAIKWSKNKCDTKFYPIDAPLIFDSSRENTLESYRKTRDQIIQIVKNEF